jgi:hypothetical protein
MPILVLIEIIAGIIALLFAGAAFVNLGWSEGASSGALQRESARKSRRMFLVAGVFAVISVVCAWIALHQR